MANEEDVVITGVIDGEDTPDNSVPESQGSWLRSPQGSLIKRLRGRYEPEIKSKKAALSKKDKPTKKWKKKIKKHRRFLFTVLVLILVFGFFLLALQGVILLTFLGGAGNWSSFGVGRSDHTMVEGDKCIHNCGCMCCATEEVQKQVGAVSVLPGNSNKEKCWNYFALAGIAGISDNPAVIAGILGNLRGESGFDPYVYSSFGFYGLFQTSAQEMIDKVTNEVGDYWHTLGQSPTAPEEAVDAAIKIELDYLLNVYAVSSGKYSFFNNLTEAHYTSGEEGAASYAELFLLTEERAIHVPGVAPHSELSDKQGILCSLCSPFQDPKVQEFANRMYPDYPNREYQGTNERRDYAKEIFNELALAGGSLVSTNISSSGAADSIRVDGVSEVDITFIGDSIGVGIETLLRTKVGAGSYFDSEVSRFVTAGGTERDGQTALSSIQGTDNLKEIVVIELGTNSSNNDPDNLQVMLESLRERKLVVMVTPYIREYYGDTHFENTKVTAEWMRTLSNAYKNIAIADWNEYAAAQPATSTADDTLLSDGVHLKDSSAQEAFTALITDAIQEALLGNIIDSHSVAVSLCSCEDTCPCLCERSEMASAAGGPRALVSAESVDAAGGTLIHGRVVYFNQGDEPWGSLVYGSDSSYTTYAEASCGPSSLAIVVSTLTGEIVTPLETGAFCIQKGWRVKGNGTSQLVRTEGAKEWGLICEEISTWDEVKTALRAGKLIFGHLNGGQARTYYDTHCTMPPANCIHGHYFVIAGITTEDKLLVADCGARSKNDKEWEWSEISGDIGSGITAIWNPATGIT